MGFINQLLTFLMSPLGLVGAALGLVLWLRANRSQQAAWLVLALCGFAASLGKFTSQWIPEPPALVFPLQQLRNAGRPMTIALVGLLLLISFKNQSNWYSTSLPLPVVWLLGVHGVIFAKNLLYGSATYAFLALGTFVALVLAVTRGPARWLQTERDFHWGAWSIAMIGVIFLTANAYQAFFNLYPITFVKGRFLGTTGNPQQAGILLAIVLPAAMYLFESERSWRRFGWLVLLLVTGFALYLTGSRMGVLMGITTILSFYRLRFTKLLRLGFLLGGIAIAVIVLSGSNDDLWQPVFTSATGRYVEIEDTRQIVWAALWRNFQNYPIFGAPLQGERLMGYGESSWLGAASSLGIIGLLPLLLFGLGCLVMILRLDRLGREAGGDRLANDMVIAGLAAILVGSIFEAILLGNLTVYTLVLLLYLALGQHLLETGAQETVPGVMRPALLPEKTGWGQPTWPDQGWRGGQPHISPGLLANRPNSRGPHQSSGNPRTQ